MATKWPKGAFREIQAALPYPFDRTGRDPGKSPKSGQRATFRLLPGRPPHWAESKTALLAKAGSFLAKAGFQEPKKEPAFARKTAFGP